MDASVTCLETVQKTTDVPSHLFIRSLVHWAGSIEGREREGVREDTEVSEVNYRSGVVKETSITAKGTRGSSRTIIQSAIGLVF